jgi:hypothetical protein
MKDLVQPLARPRHRFAGLLGMGMLTREILRSDELSDLANAQVVGLYIHLRSSGGTGRRLAKKNRQCRRFLWDVRYLVSRTQPVYRLRTGF